MNIGQLYDQTIAAHYDHDEYGLLGGARRLAFAQIAAHAGGVREVLDLAAGTGESLLAARALFPDAALHGIDLSDRMLALAEAKLPFDAIHDDVANAGRHFAPGSMDLLLMHFLTTFVDGDAVVADTANLLRPGGCYSIVSTTYEAFPAALAIGRRLLPEEAIRQMAPAPLNGEAVATYLRNAGLEVLASETFTKTLRFESFEAFYDFGMNSGFFTHVFEKLAPEQLAAFGRMAGIFPLEEHYCAAVVIARKVPGSRSDNP